MFEFTLPQYAVVSHQLDDCFGVVQRSAVAAVVVAADGFSSEFECAYTGIGDGDCTTVFRDDLVKKDGLVQVQSQAYRIAHGEPRRRREFDADFVRVGTMRDGFIPLVGVDVDLARVSPVIPQKLEVKNARVRGGLRRHGQTSLDRFNRRSAKTRELGGQLLRITLRERRPVVVRELSFPELDRFRDGDARSQGLKHVLQRHRKKISFFVSELFVARRRERTHASEHILVSAALL